MAEAAPLPYHLHQLAALCRAYPLARKVVFVPREQAGYAVGEALAAAGVPWLNLEVVTPAGDAARRIAARVADEGWQPLPPGADLFVADQIQADARDAAGAPRGMARSLLRTLQALRLAGTPPEVLAAQARTPRTRALAARYAAYVDALHAHRLLDEAQVYHLALEALADGDAVPTVYAVFDEVELPGLACRYVDALARAGLGCYRIGHNEAAGGPAVPELSAAARFPDLPFPAGAEARVGAGAYLFDEGRFPGGAAGRVAFIQSVGAENEVRAVLRAILERGLAFDTVEVAFTNGAPYLSLLCGLAERHGLPVTLATGVPAGLTRPGQALRGFFTWIEEGFPVSGLVRLMRAGLLRLDRVLGPADALPGHTAATMLAGIRTANGPQSYARALAALERDAGQGGRVAALRKALSALLAVVPTGEATAADMAAAGLAFLQTFGPTDPGEQADAYTRDQVALVLLGDLLGRVAQAGAAFAGPVGRMARHVREVVLAQYVRAQVPEPGRLHVVPIEAAGFSGRPHLFVVGMDEASAGAAPVEDPLLLDAERAALRAAGAPGLALGRDAADRAAWVFARALGRVAGTVTLACNRYDVADERPLVPSSLFLRLWRLTGGRVDLDGLDGARSGFVPPAPLACTLDDAEAWLAARAAAPDAVAPHLAERYPWCRDGRAAAEARASGRFTRFDGLLPEGDYPTLDPLAPGARFSVSRLQTLAKCPYHYFLTYVLGVRPLEERGLDDEVWLDAAARGDLLHRLFRRFLKDVTASGERPGPQHRARLFTMLEQLLDEEHARLAPPHPAAEHAVRSELYAAARVFLAAEADHCATHTPVAFELGFGLEPGEVRYEDDHVGPVVLALGDGCTLRLSGWIDRVDRRADGAYVVWDYKTGSMRAFSETDPLQQGRSLQWALYSYVLRELKGWTVARSGYFFTSGREAGARLDYAVPPPAEVAALLKGLAAMARAGCFPQAPDADPWRYGDYARLCPDPAARKHEVDAKWLAHPADDPRAPLLEGWNYASPTLRGTRAKRSAPDAP